MYDSQTDMPLSTHDNKLLPSFANDMQMLWCAARSFFVIFADKTGCAFFLDASEESLEFLIVLL